MAATLSRLSPPDSRLLAWQGWRLELPADWDPLRVEGDYDKGTLLMADLERPRLGIRWKRVGKRFDAATWTRQALRAEVGQLAAAEAVPFTPGERTEANQWQSSLLYTEPDPPGRDVWVGHSATSDRVIEIVCHARVRDRMLAETLLPTLADQPADQPAQWAVFDLACVAPARWGVRWFRFNAGDLTLGFVGPRHKSVSLRRIAPAELALARQPLAVWLATQQRDAHKQYRAAKTVEPMTEPFPGLRGTLRRRKRFGWAWWLPRVQQTLALHDAPRNRLLLLQGDDAKTVAALLQSLIRRSAPDRTGRTV